MKSNNKSKKTIAPMKIKEEKIGKNNGSEMKELSHYIDDRVALMHQVFLTIKPKKLKSMAPDCLKDMDIDEIKELCLEEVLGISTKRLKSIIQGTQCPSDTNSDSDLDEIIEHISLEEISSDDSITFMSDSEKNKKAPATEPTKSMTVLELVELQARARAIRSQLALEPIKQEIADAKNKKKAGKQKSVQKDEPPEVINEMTSTNTSPSNKSIRNYRNKDAGPDKIAARDSTVNTSGDVESIQSAVVTEKRVVRDEENEEEGEIRTSDSDVASVSPSVNVAKNKKSPMERRRKTKSRKKIPSGNTSTRRQIAMTGAGPSNIKVNVSFNMNDTNKDDEDEINLYVSDTEKQELLNETGDSTVTSRRLSNDDSESSVSIIDLNNSPLVISSSDTEKEFDDKPADDVMKVDDVKEEPMEKSSIDENSQSVMAVDDNDDDANASNSQVDPEESDSMDDDPPEENTDWKTRWMNSDKVKKVLITSKLCSNVKKKRKTAKKSDDNSTETSETVEQSDSVQEDITITGSVEEFEKLSEKDQVAKETTPETIAETVIGDAVETRKDSVEDKNEDKTVQEIDN